MLSRVVSICLIEVKCSTNMPTNGFRLFFGIPVEIFMGGQIVHEVLNC
ncbi:hypothetical protein SAMN03159444_03415 [Pseudomonas sp. NFACC02]|nr:hypothetical protein SAMN03159444_03415 [Pseudomonas sp. NFACC02]